MLKPYPALTKLRFSQGQAFFWKEEARFFAWLRGNFRPCVDKLDMAGREEFESGKVPKQLVDEVRAGWLSTVKQPLSWVEIFPIIEKAMNPRDYAAWMNCSWHKVGEQLHKLPKRIHDAIAKEEKKRCDERHGAFLANGGEKRIANYCQVWQSYDVALTRLIAKAQGTR